jgi:hypothetical protein
MKANELRIGNWYHWYADGKLYHYQIEPRDFQRTDLLPNFEPIPLTEKWAVEFGYECLVDMACSFASESKYRIEITSEDLKKMNVHEAQNLYFALTGKEL